MPQATRQKSFDQSRSKAPRPLYQRTRSDNDVPRGNAPKPREAMTGSPIRVSSQSTRKLKAFQFIEGRPSEGRVVTEENKENEIVARKDEESRPDPQATPAKPVHANSPSLVNSKTAPPSTPATRLPLADLVGNTEDLQRQPTEQVISPEDRLDWLPRSSIQATTPAPRGKKRGRSSSPVSSSQKENANYFLGGKEAFDLQNVQNSLKTPQADPAAELWNRYATNPTGKDTPITNKASAFAHLIEDSSPRSSAEAGSVGGLRRWASCGVEWPASKAKRQRTTGSFRERMGGQLEDVFGEANGEETGAANPRTSKVGVLLERIQSTLAPTPKKSPRKQPPSAPSSSSPLPDAGGFHQPDESPLQRHGPPHIEVEEHRNNGDTIEAIRDQVDNDAPPQQPTSSQFGSDIDMDMFEVAEATASARPVDDSPHENPPIESHTTGEVEMDQAEERPAQPIVNMEDILRDDDFDDLDDDDVFAADLEDLAAKFDDRTKTVKSERVSNEQHPNDMSHTDTAVPHTAVHDAQDKVVIALSDDEDEFGDDLDIDEFTAVEAVATQAQASGGSQLPSDIPGAAIQRYLITQVVEGHYETTQNSQRWPEKLLVVKDEKTKRVKNIALRQTWYDTPCSAGSYVHVIGQFSQTGECIITDAQNMLILHPDHLISATVVADSFGCIRRAALQDRVKATSKANPPQLYGHILHELFQEAMKANSWTTDFLQQTILKIIPRHFETVLEIGMTVEFVIDHLKSKLPELQSWAKIFIKAKPGPDALVKDRNGKQILMSVNKLLDVEEHVWSPMYGLKGNIDATVQVNMNDETGEKTLVIPFEVKTGRRANESHRAQTALYTLLLSDRYDVDIAYGILYYMETSEISRIPAIRHELRHMVMQRNDLACYLRQRLELPPVLKESHLCNKCYAQDSCFLYHKLTENGNGELLNSKGVPSARDKFNDLVKDLKPSDREFFQKWNTLLTKEESEMMRFRRELWTMLSDEREKLGRCFGNVILEPGSACEIEGGGKINRFQYTLVKQKLIHGFSFAESHISIGEPIVISDEQGHFALANGYVTATRKRRITVAVDRRLHNARVKQPGFSQQTNQVFAGIMDVTKDNSKPAYSTPPDEEEPALYRLDKDEFSNGMAMVRNNLIQLMDSNVYRSREFRSMIIDDKPPSFKSTPSAHTISTQSSETMNSDQRDAISKVMSAHDYALVLGMPGTGKTTTIAHIIRALVAKGKSVLLTSYTHTAVDNILLKIKKDNIDILRLGAIAKVHPEVQEFAILASSPKDSLEELERSWNQPPVVATTCLGVNHPIFFRRIFDYCIVDEASQITLPVCLGPIRMARTFILVGDHFQLPPLVQNREAMEGGLDVSLFRLLSERHPEAVVSLEHQYRMSEDVMALSNQLIYSGRLKCGNSAVASRSLSIPQPERLNFHHFSPEDYTARSSACPSPQADTCVLRQLLAPERKVLFLNTDLLGSSAVETVSGPRILNPMEATLTAQIATALITVGVDESEIGIITFYRSQLSLLRQCLRSRTGLEMHTADKFQGRDKEAIIVSCVRNNDTGMVGDLLKDWRRVNVALTRARSKLVIIGSAKTLIQGGDTLKGLVQMCKERNWCIDLQPNAPDSHYFIDEGVTQTQAYLSSGKKVPIPIESPRKSQGSPTKKLRASQSPVERLNQASPMTRMGNLRGGKGSPEKRRKTLGLSKGNGTYRNVLGAVDGNSSPTKSGSQGRKGLKQPEKRGTVGRKALMKGKPVLNDILSEFM